MADPTLTRVIRSWEPRFLANGVDPNDYRRTVDPLETWDEWYGAWMALGDRHEGLAREAAREDRPITAGEAYYRAALAYHFAAFCWVERLDEYDAGHRKRVECYGKALPYLDPPGERVEFPLERARIPAYLRKPRNATRPPVVLFLSGLDSAKEEHASFEAFFLRRGVATLTLDGPGQGETWYQMKMRADFEITATAAIDYLLSRRDVDGTRVGICGVSLGGYLAPRCAAFEPRLRAVASCGGLHSLEERPLHEGIHLARWLHIWGGARLRRPAGPKPRGDARRGCPQHHRPCTGSGTPSSRPRTPTGRTSGPAGRSGGSPTPRAITSATTSSTGTGRSSPTSWPSTCAEVRCRRPR
ncbi:MAG TPA: alpha/beta fold hydrolase [bacterium]|nr:alpha/beta fold hydrolase [bacterium]